MMKKNYTDYSFDDLLDDSEFIAFVIRANKSNEWDEFIVANKAIEETLLRAQDFILSFQIREPLANASRKQELWQNINAFRQQQVTASRAIRLNLLRRVAAVLIFVLSTGGILYYLLSHPGDSYQFSGLVQSNDSSNSVLVLSNGQKVDLGKEKAQVAVLDDENAMKINRDSIVSNIPVVENKTGKEKLNEIITPFGRKTTVILEDKTLVYLNAGSKFAFPQKFRGKTREVFLDGEGFFVVKKDSLHPFIVHSKNMNVEVYGTEFNVSAYQSDDFAKVVLVKGSVAVWKDEGLFSSKEMMVPGQKATCRIKSNSLKIETDSDPKASYAWIDGYYPFSNENLEQILRKLERYYNVRFTYNNDLTQNILPVSGKLYLKDSLSQVMSVLSQVARFDYRINNDEVLLEKRKK